MKPAFAKASVSPEYEVPQLPRPWLKSKRGKLQLLACETPEGSQMATFGPFGICADSVVARASNDVKAEQ